MKKVISNSKLDGFQLNENQMQECNGGSIIGDFAYACGYEAHVIFDVLTGFQFSDKRLSW